jgi:signal transduction histidine kinase/CheY-like chemotaxis protein
MKTDSLEHLPRTPTVTAPQKKGKEQYVVEAEPTLPAKDPREMERVELEAYLQSAEYFPTKASLLEFARRYNVPVNARTQREEIVRLCLRMIYDIPASFAGLRAAERPPTANRDSGAETRKALADFFVGTKPEDRPDGQSIKKISTGLLDSILHCHEAGLLLTQVRGADADMFLQALETCESPIETHVRFLSNLVDFARLEAGKYEFARTPFRLRDCIGEALKRLAFSAHQKNIELCYSVQADVPERVVGDPVRLQQVLINLVDNAIKFTERGEVVVEVNREDVDGSKTPADVEGQGPVFFLLRFSVRDTGVGIARVQSQALTQLFSSGNNSEQAVLGGLGLTISHRLVELMGGRMKIAGGEHDGTVCSFSVRLHGDKSNAGGAPGNLAELRGRRILVVDDNTTHRRILQDLLASWGARPHLAASGREALSLLYKQPEDDRFAAIVIDGHLSDMEGFASIRRQHLAEDPTQVSPMIMLLATVDPAREIERCQALRVATFLNKPITPAELLQSLLESLVPGTTTEEVVDRAMLWSLVAGDASLLRELIGLFDLDCPRWAFALQHAILTESRQGIVTAAHALKGAVSNFAACRVLRVLAVVESFGGQGDFTHAREAMTQLMAELSRLKLALTSIE